MVKKIFCIVEFASHKFTEILMSFSPEEMQIYHNINSTLIYYSYQHSSNNITFQ